MSNSKIKKYEGEVFCFKLFFDSLYQYIFFYYFSRPSDDVRMRLMRGVVEEEESAPVDFIDVGCCEK